MSKQVGIETKQDFQTAIRSFILGLSIPILAYIIELLRTGIPFSIDSIAKIHASNPLLWLIDSMPFFILFLSLAYNREKKLILQTHVLEKTIAERSKKITQQKSFFESLVNNSPVAIATMDADQKVVSVNQAFTNIFQYQEDEIRSKSLDDLISKGKDQDQAHMFTRQVLSGGKVHGVGVRYRKDGSKVDVEIYGVPIFFEEERIGVLGMYIDISERKRTEDMIRKSELRFRSFFHESPISMWEVDFSALKRWLDNLEYTNLKELELYLQKIPDLEQKFPQLLNIIDVNQSTLFLFKARDLAHLQEHIEEIFTDHSRKAIEKIIVDFVKGSTQIETEFPHQTLDGLIIHTIVRLSLVSGYEEDWSRVYVSIMDITERKWSEDRLRYLSLHDSMTGLYNRAFFETELKRLANGRTFPISIIVCDLDNLKRINDTYGHKAGDAVIKQTATILANSFRNEDVVARLGGDEFAVIIPYLEESIVSNLVDRLRTQFQNFNDSLQEDEVDKRINISMGTATTNSGSDIEQLFKLADQRMYAEKNTK